MKSSEKPPDWRPDPDALRRYAIHVWRRWYQACLARLAHLTTDALSALSERERDPASARLAVVAQKQGGGW